MDILIELQSTFSSWNREQCEGSGDTILHLAEVKPYKSGIVEVRY
jgi:hypothetical protein